MTPQLKGYGVYELWCDEGTALPPGTDSAPAPLVYFAAGAAFCLASHLTKLISDRKLEVRNLEIESELSFGYTSSDTTEEGVRLERGVCLGLRCLIDIDSTSQRNGCGRSCSRRRVCA